jgi:hypothetical protein
MQDFVSRLRFDCQQAFTLQPIHPIGARAMNFSDLNIDGVHGGIGSNLILHPEAIPADLDNDGTLESLVQGIDTDNDGKIDHYTIVSDLDQNGTFETTFEGIDTNHDGKIDTWTVTSELYNNGKTEQIQGAETTAPNSSTHGNLHPQAQPIPANLHNNMLPTTIQTSNTQAESWARWSKHMEDSKSVL